MRRGIAVLALSVLTACGPIGVGPFDGGASSSFSAIAPVTPLGGPDHEAQSLLVSAWLTATATSLGGGFGDVTPGSVRALDPTMDVVGDAPARVGVISLNHAGADGVVFSTKSGSGNFYCLATTADGAPGTGSVDAHGATSVDDCSGKAWTPLPS